jgi:hypothetical protein
MEETRLAAALNCRASPGRLPGLRGMANIAIAAVRRLAANLPMSFDQKNV